MSYLKTLFSFFLATFWVNLYAQPTFSLSQSDIACGEQTCLQISVQDFSDIISFQYSINWDDAILGNASVQSFGIDNLSNTNFNLATPGTARIGWDDANLTGISLSDNSVLFEICFDDIGGNATNTAVSFSGNPIPIEVVGAQGQILNANFSDGAVAITCGNTGGEGEENEMPVDTATNRLPLGFSIDSDSVNCAEQVCVDVRAQGFTDITFFRFTVSWNFRDLGQENIKQVNLPNTRFGLVAPGSFWTEWRSPNGQGVTLDDNEALYTVCFDLIDKEADKTITIDFVNAPIPILVNSVGGSNQTPVLESSTIITTCIPEDTTTTDQADSLALAFNLNSTTINCGEQTCLAVTAQDFNDIFSFQYSLNYDATLGTATIQNFGLAGLSESNFNTSTAGTVRVGWDDATLAGTSVPDDQVLFEVCFDTPANISGDFDIEFTGNPLAIEVADTEGTLLMPTFQNGTISITCEIPEEPMDTTINPTTLQFAIAEGTVNCGEQICLDVTASNFEDIISFQHSINWNTNVLGEASIRQFNLQGLGPGNFNTAAPGIIRVGWADANVTGVTLTEDAVLYQICFTAIGNEDSNSTVQFSGAPLPIEVLKSNGEEAMADFQSGNVTVECPVIEPPVDNTSDKLTFLLSETTGDCADQVCMDVRVQNFTDILSYQYSINWDANALGTAIVQGFNMPDLGIANFNANTAGVIRVGWDDTFITGVTLPDNQLIYQICFDNISEDISALPITFSGVPTSVEVVDAQTNFITPDFVNGNLTVTCTDTTNTSSENGETGGEGNENMNEELTFILGQTNANCGEQICTDVHVRNFNNILSFQYSIVWDAATLGTATVQNFGIPDINANNFNANTAGILRVGWDDTFITGVSLPDDHVIFQVCFDASTEAIENTTIDFANTPTAVEVVDRSGNLVPPTFQSGTIGVTCPTDNLVDADNDGFTNDVDCDDNNAAINPNATEIANNNVDENCDGIALIIDADNDGFNSSIDCDDNNANINGNATEIPNNGIDEDCDGQDLVTLTDNDNDGFTSDVDCDDNNPIIFPGATEFPNNNVDEDCDGVALFIDNDNDGFNSSIDCDDNNANINGNATEIPNNGIDEDCDGQDLVTTQNVDNDNDGFTSDVDCDDNNASINPNATEVPNNNIDEDCDGIALIIDIDNDGFNSSIDCDDNNANINGNATEIPNNGIDEDCDGQDLVTTSDNDNDGFTSDVDCDDNNANINPNATEIPNNNIDEDCDGVALIIDADNDGFNSNVDCDDNNAAINPNATDIANNGIDEDCSGEDLVEIDENTVVMSLSSEMVDCGNQVCLDVAVKNFNDLISFQYSLKWDATLLSNVQTQNYNLSGLNASSFFTPENGVLRVSWFDTQVQGVSIEDDQVLFQVCFDVTGTTATTTAIEFADSPIPVEVVDNQSNEVAINMVNGTVEISNCSSLVGIKDMPTSLNPTLVNTPKTVQPSTVENYTLDKVKIYPNPTQGLVNILFEPTLPQDGTVRLFDLKGQLLQTLKIVEGQEMVHLNTENLMQGVYILEVQTDKAIVRKRIIRQ